MLPILACAATTDAPSFSPRERPERDTGGADDAPADTGATDVTDSAPPAEEERDDARIVSAVFPSGLGCGDEGSAIVTVRNTGTSTWTRAAGYKLGAVDDQDDFYHLDTRVWLTDADEVPPGGEIAFAFPLVAPESEATYTTDWQMVHEGVQWFGQTTTQSIAVTCAPEALPLPDHSWVVDQVHADRPDLIYQSCVDSGGNWLFLEEVVRRLQTVDDRWGYNWKRGVVGDASQDVVDYHYGSGDHEGSTEVYIMDIIVGHCGDSPQPGWTDVTQATKDGGTIGMWSSWHE